MAVKIRLKRFGKIRAPYYRIVVADSRVKRDGKTIEEIGKYHPKEEPSRIEVNSERVQHWLSVGAQPSEPVQAILRKTGDWQKFKGEPVPEGTLLAPKEKADRRARFDEALREAHGDVKSEAVSAPAAKKSKAKGDAEKADAGKADKGDAEKADKADSTDKADDAKADSDKADSDKVEG